MKTKKTMNKEQIKERIEAILESAYEYETQHDDAGGNYWHCIKEGGWCYGNGDARLKEFMQKHGIKFTGDLDRLTNMVIDCCEAESGHIMDYEKDYIFYVDSFPVQEIETQVEPSMFEGANWRDVCNVIKDEHYGNCYDDSALLYQTSDSVWRFCITIDELKDLIDQPKTN